jgi:hypothetical protein
MTTMTTMKTMTTNNLNQYKIINMKKAYFTFLFVPLISIGVFAQKVSNIEATVSEDKILISYSVKGLKFNESLNVSLYVSLDGGSTYQGPLKEVSGDIGECIKEGNHKIYWDALKEMPFTDEELIFNVRAEKIIKEIKRNFFLSYSGNDMTPLGLRFGTIGKIGWYVEGRINLKPFESSQYNFNEGDVIIPDYNTHGYYKFTDNNNYSAMSACAGITFQPTWNFFIYAGVGYGKEEYLMEIDEYSYEENNSTGKALVKNKDYSYTGFEMDAGLIYSIGKFIISGGATTINFETFGWTAGVGVCF